MSYYVVDEAIIKDGVVWHPVVEIWHDSMFGTQNVIDYKKRRSDARKLADKLNKTTTKE